MKLPISRLATGAVLLLICVSVLFVAMRYSSRGAAQPTSTVTIKMTDLRFDADTIAAKAGQPLTIQIENDDTMDHAFSLDGANIQTDDIRPRQATSITFTPSKAGTYAFYCPVVGHAGLGMVGTLEVVS